MGVRRTQHRGRRQHHLRRIECSDRLSPLGARRQHHQHRPGRRLRSRRFDDHHRPNRERLGRPSEQPHEVRWPEHARTRPTSCATTPMPFGDSRYIGIDKQARPHRRPRRRRRRLHHQRFANTGNVDCARRRGVGCAAAGTRLRHGSASIYLQRRRLRRICRPDRMDDSVDRCKRRIGCSLLHRERSPGGRSGRDVHEYRRGTQVRDGRQYRRRRPVRVHPIEQHRPHLRTRRRTPIPCSR